MWRYELVKKEQKLILKDVIQRHRFFWFGEFLQNTCETELMKRSDFLSFYLSETFILKNRLDTLWLLRNRDKQMSR